MSTTDQSGHNTGVIVGGTVAAMLALAMWLVVPFEGRSMEPYRDVVGVLTVCHGHTGSVQQRTYTRDECDRLLRSDLGEAWRTVQRCIHAPMTDYQAAALVSFTFNVGPGRKGVKDGLCQLKNGRVPRIRQYANEGDWQRACAQLDHWVYAGGVRYRGLVRRRAAERAMCEGRAG